MKAILRRISPLQMRVTFFNSEDVDAIFTDGDNEPIVVEVDTDIYEFFVQLKCVVVKS